MRNKIRLDTMKDVNEFIIIANSIPTDIKITNGEGFTVSGKSYLGVVYASAEFEQLYVVSAEDIYDKIEKFIEI